MYGSVSASQRAAKFREYREYREHEKKEKEDEAKQKKEQEKKEAQKKKKKMCSCNTHWYQRLTKNQCCCSDLIKDNQKEFDDKQKNTDNSIEKK